MVLTRRWPVTLAASAGALAAGIGGSVVGSPAVSGVAWAALAGVALSLMLRGGGLRIVGAIVALLGLLGFVVALPAWPLVVFVLVAAAGVAMAWFGPGWVRDSTPRAAADDMWKQLDLGEDPTD